MDESRFWAVIEAAWATAAPKSAAARRKLAAGTLDEEEAYELQEVLEGDVIAALKAALAELPADDLLAFDRVLERKMIEIDRADVHEHTDGSDDGFLYCRGFIVGVGRDYFDAVAADPSKAVMDAECEEMAYVSMHLYEERFGPMPASGLCRESFCNPEGWPDEE